MSVRPYVRPLAFWKNLRDAFYHPPGLVQNPFTEHTTPAFSSCNLGFFGQNCELAEPADPRSGGLSDTVIAIIVVVCVLAFILLLVIIIALIVTRKKKQYIG